MSRESAQGLKSPVANVPRQMYYEKLALEVGATVAGYEIVRPPVIRGASGTDHRFTLVAAEGSKMLAFDIYQDVGEVEILRTYIKQMDTGAEAYVVCLSGKPREKANELSANYGIKVLGPREVGDFFTGRITRLVSASRSSANWSR